jgi:chaperone modulatory protein CbpM
MTFAMTEASGVLWLDEHHAYSITEFAALSGLTAAELQLLVECEMLLPVAAAEPAADPGVPQTRFSAAYLSLARTASRLRDDFDLDPNGLALALQLLHRIRELESELRDLRAQWPHAPR